MKRQEHSKRDEHVIIIGGGVAGLSAGCYALRSGFRTTIVEHNLALGGVCTAWQRGPYTVDGCIHWLTGGPFARAYEEVGILSQVPLRTLDTWFTYRDARDGLVLPFTRDLDAFVAALARIAPEDRAELMRLREAAAEMVRMQPPLDAPQLTPLREHLRAFWEMRDAVGTLVHFRKPINVWTSEHLQSDRLRRVFRCAMPGNVPVLFLAMVLGYLEQGWLSRPVGGTAAFRSALERSYRELGGEAILHATVDEVLVERDRATGVRLADGRMLRADIVLSTASAPETVLRLLGGRYDAAATRDRLEHWKLIEPVVLASFGVAEAYAGTPGMLLIDGMAPFSIGGRESDYLYVRVCNDDSSFAPSGHSVVQAMLPTSYEWWATRGTQYGHEKDRVLDVVLGLLEPHFPNLRASLRMTDLATPLTYWNMARSWRGAYEGWIPNSGAFFGQVDKKLSGLQSFYMAGQWVEPGGGIPLAVMSGRQVVQLMCADDGREFVAGAAKAAE